MTFKIKPYLEDITKLKASAAASEHSYRTPIQELLTEAAAEIFVADRPQILHEPKRQNAAAPDFLIIAPSSSATIGCVECKSPEADFTAIVQSPQIQKYNAEISKNILLTDGFRWLLLRDKTIIKFADLSQILKSENASKRSTTKSIKAEAEVKTDFIALLKIFFTQPEQKIADAKKLAQELARYCHELREALNAQMQNENSKSQVKALFQSFQQSIYHEMSSTEFTDAFAQTTTYCLLLAGLQNTQNPSTKNQPLTADTIYSHIPQTFALLRELSGFIKVIIEEPEISWIISDLIAIIQNMDAAEVIQTMSATQKINAELQDDPFLYFYENFLAAYDARLRERRGVYYTPLPAVRFIVRAIDIILTSEFQIPEGLAAVPQDKKEKVTVLDFATGTGTFLVEAIRCAIAKNTAAENSAIVKETLLKNYYGFEYLIAPYVIAHLKLAQFLENEQFPINKNSAEKQLKIYLANTLQDTKEVTPNLFMPALTAEANEANTIKDQQILVIMGNPPYSGHSQNKQTTSDFLDPYKHEHGDKDGIGLGEKNPKWLNDDYVKFIRFAEKKMQDAKQGIVAIITNHAFLDNPTFRGMRAHLLNTFDCLYVLDLHGNTRKKETAEDGGKDENIFDIMQGVAISIFIKNPKIKRSEKSVFHAEIFGKRRPKYDYLETNNLKSIKWKKLKPTAPFYFFIPHDNKAAAKYNEFLSLKDIFQTSSVGIVTARDKLTIGFDREEVAERIKHFANLPEEEAREFYDLGKDVRDWKVKDAQKDLHQSKMTEAKIRPIAYRPFDDRYTYFTGTSRGFHCRPRGKFMQRMIAGENLALITIRQFAAVGDDEFNAVFISNKITDLNFNRRGGALIFPLWLYDEDFGITKTANFTPDFCAEIKKLYPKKRPTPEKILAFIYAVLHVPDYRSRYAEFLRTDFPRIPFPSDFSAFTRTAEIGQNLINAHLLKTNPAKPTAKRLQLHGNPKAQKIITKISYNEATQSLHINPQHRFASLPPAVWNFSIGGYCPLEKYLKSRKGRVLTSADIQTLRHATAAIAYTLAQMQTLATDPATAFLRE